MQKHGCCMSNQMQQALVPAQPETNCSSDGSRRRMPSPCLTQMWNREATAALEYLRRPDQGLDRVLRILLKGANKRLARRPSSYPLLSGDSFRALANVVVESVSDAATADIRNDDIVWCVTHMLRDLEKTLCASNADGVTLLLGNSDQNVDRLTFLGLESLKGLKVFAQNQVETLPNVEPLPIGLENRWHAKHNPSNRAFTRRHLLQIERKSRIMWTFKVSTNRRSRTKAAAALRATPTADHFNRVSPRKHRKTLRQYAFVASPEGNGLDCHRTWEVMYLNCIPIVQKRFMTEHFRSLGLPIWVIDSYEDLGSFSEHDLEQKRENILKQSTRDGLFMDFWYQRIVETNRV